MESIRVVPANESTDDDIQTVFGLRGEAARCQCQWFRMSGADFRATPREVRRDLQREQTACGDPSPADTSGLVAYLDDEPVGWCAVAPRTVYPHLRTQRVPWSGRDEDQDDDAVWVVSCFVTRAGYRRRGVAAALTAATPEFARTHGARILEAYPMVADPERDYSWGELYVGIDSVFERAGFELVNRPTPRRVVMRMSL